MLKVEIISSEVSKLDWEMDDRRGTTYYQIGYAYLPGEPHPSKFRVKLDKNQSAYAPGFYSISPSVFVIRNEGLKLGSLVPLVSSSSNQKAA